MTHENWNGFKEGVWQNEINVRDFIQKNYTDSITQLKKLLGTNRTEKVTNRAMFYLGQSYYFQNNYQQSINSFLQVYDAHPELAKKWIDSSLDLMKLPDYESM